MHKNGGVIELKINKLGLRGVKNDLRKNSGREIAGWLHKTGLLLQ
jgi:hypothetical protein